MGIEDYWGKEPYIRVRFKFDEDVLRKHLSVEK
jgi:hypothetical protein